MIDLIGLAIAIPLLAAAVNMLFGSRLGRWAGWFATAAMAASFAIALAALLDLLALPAQERTQVVTVAEWIRAGAASVALDLRVDPLSITMAMVVTGVGSLIHLYAIGYMEHDPRPGRFFGYMNLFCAFMLVLVLANDFLLLYLGLGRRRALLVPADRLLVGSSRGGPRREEGVHHHACRRRAADARVCS